MRMTKTEKRHRLISRLSEMGFNYDEAQALRRIEMTLSRWSELECGTGDARVTRSVERDEITGKPFLRIQFMSSCGTWQDDKWPCADREAGALKRLEKIIAKRNARFESREIDNRESGDNGHVVAYHQGDPRGCALYIVRKSDLNGSEIDSNYTKGIAVCD